MKLKHLSLFLFSTSVFLFSCSDKKDLSKLSWLIGAWEGNVAEITFHEMWVQETNTRLNGSTYAIQNGDTVYKEKMKIEQLDENLYYITNVPNQEQPVLFKLNECSDEKAVFENAETAFPKKIIYELRNDSLHVKLQGMQDNKNVEEALIFIKK